MKSTYYECNYYPKGGGNRCLRIRTYSDEDAIKTVHYEMKKMNIDSYKLTKITEELLFVN